MWLMIPEGFVSATMCPAKFQDGGDHPLMQVRGRRREHVEGFLVRGQVPGGLDNEIIETPERDYRYRVILRRDVFQAAMSSIVASMDYNNFKNKAASVTVGRRGSRSWLNALHDVWEIMGDLQPGGPYGLKERSGWRVGGGHD